MSKYFAFNIRSTWNVSNVLSRFEPSIMSRSAAAAASLAAAGDANAGGKGARDKHKHEDDAG